MMRQLSVVGSGKTVIGDVWVAVSSNGVAYIQLGRTRNEFIRGLKSQDQQIISDYEPQAEVVIEQIHEYLQERRKRFDLQVDWLGMTVFQCSVLKAVLAIPYGETRTYGQIAAQIGRPGAARAVGRANATNPIPLVIPCHRVIGFDGSLRGYGAGDGLKTKAWLLDLESNQVDGGRIS
jgi:methylated-DNA-[protein]-cysteine S-methyltransferase